MNVHGLHKMSQYILRSHLYGYEMLLHCVVPKLPSQVICVIILDLIPYCIATSSEPRNACFTSLDNISRTLRSAS